MGFEAEEMGKKENEEESWNGDSCWFLCKPISLSSIPAITTQLLRQLSTDLGSNRSSMKRLSSSDSLEEAGSRLIPIHSSLHAEEKGMYGRGFQSIMEGLEEDECGEDDLCSAAMGEKKRRLSVVQVKALEKTFEVENKLDPERKVRLAQDLGLQPRQVAVWFQNRRARWKTKQLERDFSRLKANFESLKLNYDALHLDKEALLLEVKELRSKLVGEESYSSGKQEEEELVASESENKASEETPVALLYRDGSMDSDSSAILNDESSPHQGISSSNSGFISQNHYQLMTMGFNSSSPFEYSESRALKGYYQNQFGSEEPSVSFFSDEQDPAFSWYSTEQWN